MRRRNCLLAIAAGICALTPLKHASARRRVRLRGGRKIYGPRTLRPNELKECVDKEKSFRPLEGEIAALEADLEAASTELRRFSDQLNYENRVLDNTNSISVDFYNKKVDQYQHAVDKYNNGVEQYETKRNKLNRMIASYNADCADREYYEEDITRN